MESFCRFPVLIRAFALFCAIDLALACNGFACHGGRRAVRRVGGGYRCICDAGHRGENVDEPAPRQRREADMGESPVIGETEEEMGESPAMDESEGEAAITGESLTMDESEGEAAITGGSPVIGESEGEAAIMEENSVIDESEGEAAITDDSSVTDDSDGEAAIMGESSVIGESEGEAELLIGDNESESGKTSPIEDESEGEAAVTGESFIGESEDSMGESLVESEGGADVIGESSVVGESEEERECVVSNCFSCSTNKTTCVTCIDGFYLVNNNCRKDQFRPESKRSIMDTDADKENRDDSIIIFIIGVSLCTVPTLFAIILIITLVCCCKKNRSKLISSNAVETGEWIKTGGSI